MNVFKKYLRQLQDNISLQTDKARGRVVIAANIVLIAFQLLYLYLRYAYINNQVPFWFTKTWGDAMLANKSYLFLIPASALAVLIGGLIFEVLFRRYFVRYLKEVILTFITLSNVLLTASLLRIIFLSSVPFPPIIDPLLLSLLAPFFVAFGATAIILPWFINFVSEKDIVTNPKIHQHPGMLLQKPTARGGGVLYAFIFIVLAFIFVGLPSKLVGFFVALIMLGILGYVDDYQNTHAKSAFKALENPALRFLLQAAAVAVLVLSGVVIKTVGNPFGGIIDLTQYMVTLSYVFTVLWIVWILNLLSWSNGIDGQFGGIVGIVSVFICVLALRFTPLAEIHRQVAMMAAISAGIAFGFTKYAWYPSEILWGFGATTAGLVISSLSILINTKIIVSILILLIPFLDASVTIVRRLIQRKNPFVGDRRHMHHLLLDRGWSIQKIAKFYWITTFIFGLIGLVSSDKYLLQTVLIVGGVVAFIIVLMNLKPQKAQEA